MPTLRLLPIVLFAAASLLVLKMLAIVGGHGYALGDDTIAAPRPAHEAGVAPFPASAAGGPERAAVVPTRTTEKRSWAQEVLGFPDITGSVGGGSKPPAAEGAEGGAVQGARAGRGPTTVKPKEAPLPFESRSGAAPGETAVLERLGERRQELEERGRELDIREGLLKAAEQRLEARMEELKALESQNETAGQRKNEAEAARVRGLVTMYENMKAKDAARIFDRLEMRILLDLATQINPRRMADILSAMTPEAAERLTGELANRGTGGATSPATSELPKIEGKPRS